MEAGLTRALSPMQHVWTALQLSIAMSPIRKRPAIVNDNSQWATRVCMPIARVEKRLAAMRQVCHPGCVSALFLLERAWAPLP